MMTFHERAAQDVVVRWASDSARKDMIPLYRILMRTGGFDRAYVDAVGQDWSCPPSLWPDHYLAAFVAVEGFIIGGKISQAIIRTRSMPFRDCERVENARVLAELPRPFRAEVDLNQNGAEQDGWLYWDEPIVVERSVSQLVLKECPKKVALIRLRHSIPPGCAPLEIGATQPSRTVAHFGYDGGVARWPYQAIQIRLFVSARYPKGVSSDRGGVWLHKPGL